MKALSYLPLILFGTVWMLGGCVQGTPRTAQPVANPPVVDGRGGAEVTTVSPSAGRLSRPDETLSFLDRAVDAGDWEAVKAAFAPPFRSALAQWTEQAGQDAVLQTLRAGLTASRDASQLFALVRHARDGQARWETRVATWETALPILGSAQSDTSVARVEVEHRGFYFAPYGESWLLERW